jgi:tetratricopeptide (TPR) repeat protein
MHALASILLAVFVLSAQSGDEEIFKRVRALWDQGQQVEALKACKELIKNYPNSKYVPDAYLMFGEYYFDQAKLNKALMAYKKVTQYKDSKVYSYALYKTGWCYFNIQEFEKALATFVSVVKHETGRQSNLRREALNDTVLAYSHAGKANAAPAFFKRLAPNEAGKLLAALAGMYLSNGKAKDAILVYQYLLSKEKCSPHELVYQQKIIDCTLLLGNKELTVKETGRLVVMFGQLENCLVNPTTRQQEVLNQSRQESEQALFDLAVAWSKEAEATKAPDTFKHARKVAEHYLELFPNHSRAGEIRGLIR